MLRIGIIGCSEIAFRRFLPAAREMTEVKVVAVAEERTPQKLKQFCGVYSIEGETSFEKLLARADIDAVYVPQPPALHYHWAKRALELGKHVLIEKPSTTCYADSLKLVELAGKKGLALHENYMFRYHSQLRRIQGLIADGVIGDIRLLRADFGFPMRAGTDFRYDRKMGGGALLDAGGYTLSLARLLLGPTVKVNTGHLNYLPGYEVDMYGSATLSNIDGVVFQAAFGMDCGYRCGFEVWGSKGILRTNRIFTAPPDYVPAVEVETAEGKSVVSLEADNNFIRSIEEFCMEIKDNQKREAMYADILLQSKLVDDVKDMNDKAI